MPDTAPRPSPSSRLHGYGVQIAAMSAEDWPVSCDCGTEANFSGQTGFRGPQAAVVPYGYADG